MCYDRRGRSYDAGIERAGFDYISAQWDAQKKRKEPKLTSRCLPIMILAETFSKTRKFSQVKCLANDHLSGGKIPGRPFYGHCLAKCPLFRILICNLSFPSRIYFLLEYPPGIFPFEFFFSPFFFPPGIFMPRKKLGDKWVPALLCFII